MFISKDKATAFYFSDIQEVIDLALKTKHYDKTIKKINIIRVGSKNLLVDRKKGSKVYSCKNYARKG